MIRIKYLRKGRKIPWQERLRSGGGVATHVMNHVNNLSTDLSAHAASPLVSSDGGSIFFWWSISVKLWLESYFYLPDALFTECWLAETEGIFLHLKTVWVGTAGVTWTMELENFMATKLKVNFLVLRQVALLLSLVTMSAQKPTYIFVSALWFRGEKAGEFWIQKVLRARLDTFLRLSSIDEIVSIRGKLCKTSE